MNWDCGMSYEQVLMQLVILIEILLIQMMYVAKQIDK